MTRFEKKNKTNCTRWTTVDKNTKKDENKQETSRLDKIISLQHTKIDQQTIIDKNISLQHTEIDQQTIIDKNKQEYIPTEY